MSPDPLHETRHRQADRRLAHTLLTVGMLSALACSADTGGGDAAGGDTGALAGATPAAASGAAGDTGMAGMDHSKMGGMDHAAMANMNRSPARDSTQTFLRMMSDHHQGLIAMADSAGERAAGTETKADAERLHHEQAGEQQRMLTMLSSQYSDSITPTIMPSNRAMLDSLLQTSGQEFDPTFYAQVIAHHREAIQMIDQYLPHMTGEARQMAERMRAVQQREIQEFERKMGQTGRG